MNSGPRTISLSTGNLFSAVEEYLHRLNLINKDEEVGAIWQEPYDMEGIRVAYDHVWNVSVIKESGEVKLSDKKEKSDA